MVSVVTALILGTAVVAAYPAATADNHAHAYIRINFFLAYSVFFLRLLKCWFGIDHNESPRYDLVKHGPAAVKSGGMTQKQWEVVQRNEPARANTVENYAFFVGAMAFATIAGVDNQDVNKAGMAYTVSRVVYALFYILADHRQWSMLRSYPWWAGNSCCFYLLLKAGQKSNQG